MQRNFAIGLVVIIAISAAYSTFVYLSLVSVLETNMMKYLDGFIESQNKFQVASSNYALEMHQEICDDVVISTEIERKYETEPYYFDHGECDQEKLKKFGENQSSEDPTTYMVMAIKNGVTIISTDFRDTLKERYPRETLLFTEKFADVFILLYFVGSYGDVWAYSQGVMFSTCMNESSEFRGVEDIEADCAFELIGAMEETAAALKSDIKFDNAFLTTCRKWDMFGGLIGNAQLPIVNQEAICQRMKSTLGDVFDVSISTPDLDIMGKFFITTVFHRLETQGNYQNSKQYKSSLSDRIKANLDPKYWERFEKNRTDFDR